MKKSFSFDAGTDFYQGDAAEDASGGRGGFGPGVHAGMDAWAFAEAW